MSGVRAERYAVYKDSGIEWLGDIPEHWSLARVKSVTKTQSGTTPKSESSEYYDNGEVDWIRTTDLNNGHLFESQYKITAKAVSDCGLKFIPVNSVLLAMYGGMGTIGKNSLLRQSATINQSVCAVLPHPKRFISSYLWYYVQYFRPHWELFADSARKDPNINQEAIKRLWLVLPRLQEQTKIAAYLDIKTAQIDRKIDFLNQKVTQYGKLKQSLINETVTRGLDKSVPMKDSGVEWIGEVPEHWEVTAITNITEVVSYKNHPDEELLSVYRDYGVIVKSSRDDNHNKAGADLTNYKLVKEGFLVINKMKAWQGSLGVSEFRGIVSPAYITCKTNQKIVARSYLHHLLRCRNYINEYNRLSFGVRVDQWDMRYDDFKYVPILLPPMKEQAAIAGYLDTKTAQIDHIVTTINTQIKQLKELRKALINDVVTGKIKVVNEGQPT